MRPTRRRFRGHIDRGRRGPPELSRTSVGTVSLFGLAPQGVCLAEYVATLAGDAFTSPFHHRPPRASEGVGLSLLCCTLPSGRPAWPLASLLSYGVRTFLYPARLPDGNGRGQRSPDLLHDLQQRRVYHSDQSTRSGAKLGEVGRSGAGMRQLTAEPGISYDLPSRQFYGSVPLRVVRGSIHQDSRTLSAETPPMDTTKVRQRKE